MNYLISYDLIKDKDYIKLFNKIQQCYNDNVKILLSCWLIKSNKKVEEIYMDLKSALDEDDEIFIIEINIENKNIKSLNQLAIMAFQYKEN